MNKLFSSSIILICIFCSFFSFGQHFDVRTIESNILDNSFVVFSNSDYPDAAQKINQHIQLLQLQLLEYGAKDNIFEIVAPNPEISGNVGDMFAEIFQNSEKLLSLCFYSMPCGANCSVIYNYYNFNPKNGDFILLEDLIKKEKHTEFVKMVKSKRLTDLETRVKKAEEQEGQKFDHLEYLFEAYEADELFRHFYITDDTVYIDGFMALHRLDYTLDVDLVSKFSVEDLKGYLNEYGKIALGLSSGDIEAYRSTSIGQVYTGTINGNLDIIFVLTEYSSDYMAGIYVYKKYGRGIELDVELQDETYFIRENDEDFNQTNFIELKRTNANNFSFSGKWLNKTKTKSYPIEITR